jgi:hypothetical protein
MPVAGKDVEEPVLKEFGASVDREGIATLAGRDP